MLKLRFNQDWLSKDLYPDFAQWICRVPSDSNRAWCKACDKPIDLSNMGSRALKSHMQSKKHLDKTVRPASQRSLVDAFTRPENSSPSQATSSQSSTAETEATDPSETPSGHHETPVVVPAGCHFSIKPDVLAAELRWVCHCIEKDYFFRSCRKANLIFKSLFPDSKIAEGFGCSSDKATYLCCYGLAPYFRDRLRNKAQRSDSFVISFDESLNRIAQRGQYDMLIRFWDADHVEYRYLDSVFLTSSSAVDLMRAFKKCLSGFQLDRLVQISMDGPNVNWRFYDDFTTELSGFSSKNLLEIGSCGLHIVHGAFQTGNRASGWNLNSFLGALFRLFKDSPKRRGDFVSITGSRKFPLKFSAVRWTENVKVVSRAIEILPHLKEFVNKCHPKPATDTFQTIRSACDDKLLLAKLEFFSSVARIIQPFIVRFQSPAPRVPYLYEALRDMLQSVMTRFVKGDVLDNANSTAKLMQIDCSYGSDSVKVAKHIDLGFGANKALASSKASDAQKLSFFIEASKFLCAMTNKLIERSPLRYKMVRGASSIEPSLILKSPELARSRMKVCIELLLNANRITSSTADGAFAEFNAFSRDDSNLSLLKECNDLGERLDVVYHRLLSPSPEHQKLFLVVQVVLLLSHGNAAVESGFSVNNDFLVENLKEETLVSQRIVYDGLAVAGGAAALEISPALLEYARRSRLRYREALEAKKKTEAAASLELDGRKRAAQEVAALQKQKKQSRQEADERCKSLDQRIQELKTMI